MTFLTSFNCFVRVVSNVQQDAVLHLCCAAPTAPSASTHHFDYPALRHSTVRLKPSGSFHTVGNDWSGASPTLSRKARIKVVVVSSAGSRPLNGPVCSSDTEEKARIVQGWVNGIRIGKVGYYPTN